jgi:tetrahydromethanopterin S-methyltransferase subunit G
MDFASVKANQRCEMSQKSNTKDTETEAKRILERVAQESETVGTSSVKRVAERVKDHMSAQDADENEWAELWGKRIGRALGAVFVVVLIIYLVKTYILHA